MPTKPASANLEFRGQFRNEELVQTLPALDSAEFGRLLDRLAYDIVDAAIFRNLYADLSASVEDYWREFSQSGTFWSLSFQAYVEVVMLRLSRIYVGHGTALSLGSWLQAVKDNQQFSEPHDSDQLEQDIRSVSDDPTVKKLVCLRHSLIAHINWRDIAENLRLGDRFALSPKEIDLLIERAGAILNRYGILLKGAAWSNTIVGRDDFKTILKALRSDLERREAEIAEEIERADRAVAPETDMEN